MDDNNNINDISSISNNNINDISSISNLTPPSPPSQQQQQQQQHDDHQTATFPLTNLTTPDPTIYETFETLLTALQSHAKTAGYGLVIESSRPTHGIVKLACDLHGKQRNHRNLTPSSRVRKRRPSRKCDCPMRVRCWRLEHESRWTFAATQPGHNHAASADPAVHVVHRKRGVEVLQEVEASVVEGQRTRDVLERVLKGDGEACYSRRDIYNDRAKVKRALNNKAGAAPVLEEDAGTTDPRLSDAVWLSGVGIVGLPEMGMQGPAPMLGVGMGGVGQHQIHMQASMQLQLQDPGLSLGFSSIMVLPLP